MGTRKRKAAGVAARAHAAYVDGTTGSFQPTEELVEELRGQPHAAARAWVLALRAQRWHAEMDRGTLPQLGACADFLGEEADARAGAVLTCAEVAKRAVLLHRVTELRDCTDLQRRLIENCDHPWAVAAVKLSIAWLALAEGKCPEAEQLAGSAAEWASKNNIAPAVIEATIIRAQSAEAFDDLDEATSLARRAARMARTEDLPQCQYLASLWLARMRRLNGLPHLTTRILRPMLRVAPKQWHSAIAWEVLMAGDLALGQAVVLDDDNDPAGEARALRRLLLAAVDGDRSLFASAADELEAMRDRWPFKQSDADLVVAALDATRELGQASEKLQAWSVGHSGSPPAAVKGLCIDLSTDPSDPGPAAFVVAGPLVPSRYVTPRRVAGLGEPLLASENRIPRVKGKFERNLTTLSTIGLSGPEGIARTDLFRIVYGFEFDPNVHGGVFNTLLYRVRKLLGDFGSIVSDESDRFRLDLSCPLVIPDPRCGQSLEDLVLGVIAHSGASGAKDAADSLGTPLRTTQTAIQRLVEDGALAVVRQGKHVRYQVEDTTFSEPTRWASRDVFKPSDK